jgi:hypothetical protein
VVPLPASCTPLDAAMLDGMDEPLTVVRFKLPPRLRRFSARTNIIANMLGSIRRLKAHKQLSMPRAARAALQAQNGNDTILASAAAAA